MKQSFIFAFKGVLACVKSERNFRFHMAFAFYVLIAAIVTQLTETEWLLILICIGAVMGAEIFNTAIEKLCDTLHPNWSKGIGMVKDMTAGAVLMFAVSSAAIGGIIFFNSDKIMRAVSFARGHIALSVLIIISLPAAVFLVFRRYGNDNKSSHDYDSRTPKRR
jgi:diacylglycerol kinase (ATP)